MVATPATAQVDTQVWSSVSTSGPVAPGLLLNVDASLRWFPNMSRLGQALGRVQLGHTLSDRVTIWAGYVRGVTTVEDGRDTLEQRAVGQLNWVPGRLAGLDLFLRTRLEARFIRGRDGPSWRLRQQVRAERPVGPVRLAAYLEPFVQLNRPAGVDYPIDQLRGFAGVDVPVGRGLAIESGFLEQYEPRPGRDRDNRIVPVTLNWKW